MLRQGDVLTLSATPSPYTAHVGRHQMQHFGDTTGGPLPSADFCSGRRSGSNQGGDPPGNGRSGQVFFVYNRVADSTLWWLYMHALARIVMAHGQMRGRTIRLYILHEQEYDVGLHYIIEMG